MTELTFVDELKQLPASTRLAFAMRWVRSLSTILVSIAVSEGTTFAVYWGPGG